MDVLQVGSQLWLLSTELTRTERVAEAVAANAKAAAVLDGAAPPPGGTVAEVHWLRATVLSAQLIGLVTLEREEEAAAVVLTAVEAYRAAAAAGTAPVDVGTQMWLLSTQLSQAGRPQLAAAVLQAAAELLEAADH